MVLEVLSVEDTAAWLSARSFRFAPLTKGRTATVDYASPFAFGLSIPEWDGQRLVLAGVLARWLKGSGLLFLQTLLTGVTDEERPEIAALLRPNDDRPTVDWISGRHWPGQHGTPSEVHRQVVLTILLATIFNIEGHLIEDDGSSAIVLGDEYLNVFSTDRVRATALRAEILSLGYDVDG